MIIFFAPLGLYIFNADFYNKLYIENNVYESLKSDSVQKMTSDIFEFFQYRGDLRGDVRFADPLKSSTAFFTDSEISHMEDVRDLLKNIFILFLVSLAILAALFIILVSTDKKKNLRKIGFLCLWSSSIVLFIFILFYILSTNFSYLFNSFHAVFFPQGNFMFPEGSLLITLSPFGFFYQFFIRLIISSSAAALVLLIAGIICISVQRKYERIFKIGK
ncbi:MAG: DUF1461 domain-containing protein [Actinomycetia bacterium]|nr:DUF1461 domain-containing protein [Actinomycetes bacterium]